MAAEIVAALPKSVEVVGVFVDRPAEEVAEFAESLGLGIVQLHGQEPPEDLLQLERFRVIRAFRLGDASAWDHVSRYLERANALGRPLEGVLVDAYVPGQPGGTGASIADKILDRMPPLPRLILAGGLTPGNVAGRVCAGSALDGRRRQRCRVVTRPEGRRRGRRLHSSGSSCRLN